MIDVSHLRLPLAAALGLVLMTGAGVAQGTPLPGWTATFGQEPGAHENNTVHFGVIHSLVQVDHGDGPVLYAGGTIDKAGGVTAFHIAQWDGAIWKSLAGYGMDDWVFDLVEYDDGNGPVLVAGGRFEWAGGVEARHVVCWDGDRWSPLGDGLRRTVRDLVVFDDGNGPALYAAGGDLGFLAYGDSGPGFVHRWDGQQWKSIGGFVDTAVETLAVYDDGNGPALYAAGNFTTIRGKAAERIARWDGNSWSPLGAGVDDRVRTLAVFDGGNGPELYAGGDFTQAGGSLAMQLATWNGSAWSPVMAGFFNGAGGPVYTLLPFDDGNGEQLYAGGQFGQVGGLPAKNIARWDGNTWTPMSGGTDGTVTSLGVFDDGSGAGPMLHVGGYFAEAGGLELFRVARWENDGWAPLGDGLGGSVMALAEFDDGNGPAVYAAGWFETADGEPLHQIGRWEGDHWSPLNFGFPPEGPGVQALVVWDDGNGEALYATGSFKHVDGMSARGVARWDGTDWSALGTGVRYNPYAIEVFDDGTGEALYVAGSIDTAGGVDVENIAKWDGSSWSPVGLGLSNVVHDLEVFNDGAGPSLYAVGDFQKAGGAPAKFIARWDGTSWSPVRGGLESRARALAVYDDGTGEALYVGGQFDSADGVPAPAIARWDRNGWSAVPTGLTTIDSIETFTVFDDGNGLALFAAGNLGGSFGGDYTQGLARWDGTNWTSLGKNTDRVRSLLGVGAGVPGGPALFVGGFFGSIERTRDSNLSRYVTVTPAP